MRVGGGGAGGQHGDAAAGRVRQPVGPGRDAVLEPRLGGELADVVGGGSVGGGRRGRLRTQQLALGEEPALGRGSHGGGGGGGCWPEADPDEVGSARLRRRARVGPVGRGAHVRGIIARARPSPRYRYRTAYGQKEKGAAG